MKRASTLRHVLEIIGLTLAIYALGAALFWGWWVGGWTSAGAWREAWRDGAEPRMLVDRWVYLRWIHPDSQYWLSHVDFGRGPVTVEGLPPDAPYWSLTWYASTHTNGSIDDRTATFDADGRYRATFGPARGDAPNWVEVPDGTRRAVLYLRVYDPRHAHPTPLPSVAQGGRRIAVGGVK